MMITPVTGKNKYKVFLYFQKRYWENNDIEIIYIRHFSNFLDKIGFIFKVLISKKEFKSFMNFNDKQIDMIDEWLYLMRKEEE